MFYAKGHIALDLDDCILDFTGGVRAAIKNDYGVEVPPFTEWEIRKVLNPILGEDWWAWLKRREWLWSHFDAVEGAIGTIDLLRKDGYYLEIVTSKPEWAEYNVWRWMGKWRPAVHRVTIVNKDDSKFDFTEADVLVDDKPDAVVEFATEFKYGILFDRSHNRAFDVGNVTPARLYRACGWPDVRRIVREILP